MSQTVVIIGGGIGGLAVANLLARDGFSVTIFDNHDTPGGRARRKQQDGFTFDTGPSWYLMPQVFKDYFSLFQKDVEQELSIQRLSPAYKVFFESREPLTIHGELNKDSETFESIETGAGEALRQYVEEGSSIYQTALKYFLYTDFSRPQNLLKKEVVGDIGRLFKLLTTPIHQRVQQFVKTPALQQILEYPMVFLGTSPFKAPAMYSLMSALDFKEGVYYPKDGMYSIIELLVGIGNELGVTYKQNAAIEKITHTGGEATGVVLKNGRIIEADIVISNGDLHHTETQLLTLDAQSYPESFWRKKEAGISALLMYLGVKGEMPELEHHNLYFVNDWQDNFESIYTSKTVPERASVYVSRTTATDPSTAPEGHENLFVLVPLPTDISLSENDQMVLADRILDELAQATGVADLQERIVSKSIFGPDDFREEYYAWQGTALGMSHLLKQSALWRIPPKSKKLNNLYYVGANTMPGIGLPMCIISAELVYKKITGNRSTEPLARNR